MCAYLKLVAFPRPGEGLTRDKPRLLSLNGWFLFVRHSLLSFSGWFLFVRHSLSSAVGGSGWASCRSLAFRLAPASHPSHSAMLRPVGAASSRGGRRLPAGRSAPPSAVSCRVVSPSLYRDDGGERAVGVAPSDLVSPEYRTVPLCTLMACFSTATTDQYSPALAAQRSLR